MIRLPLAAAAFVLSVLAANLLTANFGLVPVGFGLQVTAGTYAAGFALLARDFVQRYATDQYDRRRAIALSMVLIGFAGALSYLTASPQLALASTVAFLGAELVDLAVFTPLRDRWGFGAAAVSSNAVSAPIDTVLFLALAGFPLTWPAVVGQFIAKVLYATLVPVVLWALIRLRREPAAA